MNNYKRIFAIFFIALGITLINGCMVQNPTKSMSQQAPSTITILSPFDAEKARILSLDTGTNIIYGTIPEWISKVASSPVGAVIALVPATDYTIERVKYLYNNENGGFIAENNPVLQTKFSPDYPEYKTLLRIEKIDTEGNFLFENVQDGIFFILLLTRNGTLIHKVEVKNSDIKNILISPTSMTEIEPSRQENKDIGNIIYDSDIYIVKRSSQPANFKIMQSNANFFDYPNKIENIKNIYLNMQKYDNKDQFETSEEHIQKIMGVIKKSYGNNGNVVVAPRRFISDYNADKAILTFKMQYGSNDSATGYFVSARDSQVLIIKEFITKGHFSGTNAFGVYNSGTKASGEVYAINPVNPEFMKYLYGLDYKFSISDVNVNDAKILTNKNIEIFFVCVPAIFRDKWSKSLHTIKDGISYSAPTIDSDHAWDIKIKSVHVKVNAMLICDKSQKRVLAAITF